MNKCKFHDSDAHNQNGICRICGKGYKDCMSPDHCDGSVGEPKADKIVDGFRAKCREDSIVDTSEGHIKIKLNSSWMPMFLAELNQETLDLVAIADYFVYKSGSMYKVGLKVTAQYMIPMPEIHTTLASAEALAIHYHSRKEFSVHYICEKGISAPALDKVMCGDIDLGYRDTDKEIAALVEALINEALNKIREIDEKSSKV